ncbi:MAG: CheB methylesterase domain-containing protein, partial [Deltaproteobacteria bacterium]
TVREAVDGEPLEPGVALVAPGGMHLSVRRAGVGYAACVQPGPRVNGHCPAVDVLFDSVAKYVGAKAIGLILTGMGSDGANGMLAMREAGATTAAQDEATSVVYGMPRVAAEIGAAQRILSLPRIGTWLAQAAYELHSIDA